VVAPGLPHHVTQRGNARQVTFLSDEDRFLYLDLLGRYRRKYGLHLWAYCLMDNHVHLLAVPERADSLTRTLGRTHADYARYWNLRQGSCGHVWQARFYSCPIEHDQTWVVARYVELNPVRAGMVELAEQWPWSSAQAHVTGRETRQRLEMAVWAREYDGVRWATALRTTVENEAWQRRLEEATMQGWPLGSEPFVDELEHRLGTRLRPNPPGRPPKPIVESALVVRQMSLEIGN
jgi:putative transposase